MTNIEKVKRILDAGHWVKVTYEGGTTFTITSYINNSFSYINENEVNHCIFSIMDVQFQDCTIEVIQRIPTPYVAGDKVLVLSNPSPSCVDSEYIDEMVGKVLTVKAIDAVKYAVYNYDKSDYFLFPPSCLAPAFEEDSLSGKEAKIVIDGKEYSVTLKLI